MEAQLDAFRLSLPYLNSDRDRLNLITCCKSFRVLLKHVHFVRTYEYDRVKHSGYIKFIHRIRYIAIAPKASYAYDKKEMYTSFIIPSNYITDLATYSGSEFGLRSFPSRLHLLEIRGRWCSNYILSEIVPKTLRILVIADGIHERDIPTTVTSMMLTPGTGKIQPPVGTY